MRNRISLTASSTDVPNSSKGPPASPSEELRLSSNRTGDSYSHHLMCSAVSECEYIQDLWYQLGIWVRTFDASMMILLILSLSSPSIPALLSLSAILERRFSSLADPSPFSILFCVFESVCCATCQTTVRIVLICRRSAAHSVFQSLLYPKYKKNKQVV
ncbi:hypothetical protein GOODEAATRI_015943 [Goodea atripinnis]|uniref:Uncharacterized protein n=1 Tax=Goodea atripinnis TaxID=208336 RepID=A0ABV0NYB9_9TELE